MDSPKIIPNILTSKGGESFWKWFEESDFVLSSFETIEKNESYEIKKAKMKDKIPHLSFKQSQLYKDQLFSLKFPIGKIDFEKQYAELFHVMNCSVLIHPNLLNYVGGIKLGNGTSHSPFQVGLIVEYIPTTLRIALEKDSRLQDFEVKINIAKQIASGMNFLHSLTPCVLHRDLRSCNIFITDMLECKIGEYRHPNYPIAQGDNVTHLIPPELEEDKTNFTKLTDVYFFGWILVELILGISTMIDYKLDHLLPFIDLVKNQISEAIFFDFKTLILLSLSKDPQKRLSFFDICAKLNQMMGLNIDIELIAQKKHLSLTDTNGINVAPPACLMTSGHLWKRGNDVFGLWRKRKFELKDNTLFYFKSQAEKLGQISLLNAVKFSNEPLLDQTKVKPNSFSIQVPERQYMLQAIDSNEFHLWWDSLSYIIGQLKYWHLTPEVNVGDTLDRKIVHQFCIYGNLEGLKTLVRTKGPSILEEVDKYDMNCAHFAVRSGHLSILQFLAENQFRKFNETESRFGMTPLYFSLVMKHKECTEFLIFYTSIENLNIAFGLVCQDGDLEMLKLLYEQSFKIFPNTDKIKLPIETAIDYGHLEIIRYLLMNQPNVFEMIPPKKLTNLLWIGCFLGEEDILRFLMNHQSIDVNVSRSEDGSTPLYVACSNGKLEIVKILVELKADINKSRNSGTTPLYIACQNGFTEIAKFLLEKGANPNRPRITDGNSPLSVATSNGNLELVELLISYGANVNLGKTDDGTTPLLNAVSMGSRELIELLLKKGANPNTPRKEDGTTPLFIASQNGNLELVQLLLKHGADTNRTKTTGTTSLFIASQKGNKEIVKVLLEAGADPTKSRNTDGATPIFIATLNKHQEIVELLEKYQKEKKK